MNPFMIYSSQLQNFVTFARHYMSFRLHLKNKSFFMTEGKILDGTNVKYHLLQHSTCNLSYLTITSSFIK